MMMASALGAEDRRAFTLALGMLIVLAWVVLAVWGASPYGRLLDHDEASALVLGGDPFLALAVVFGWVVMIVAMMLPTTMPLVLLFQALAGRRRDGSVLVLLLLAGYLGVWTLFGTLVHAGDLLLHALIEQSAWLEVNAWLISPAVLVLAGLYQFTPLKYYCLDKCRSPMSFILEHWQGRRERFQALALGVHHGLFCLGCCWSLMLLMFAVGVGNLGWMLVLGAVMAIEKNLPWGRRLSAPLGVGLLAWGLLAAVAGWGSTA